MADRNMDREEAYNLGYQAGFEGYPFSQDAIPPGLVTVYGLGFDNGQRDREEVQRSGSSNS
jgi:hypothetical protein